MRIFILSVCLLLLSACATQNAGLYQWGQYENQLYMSYKDPSTTQILRTKLEEQIAVSERSQRKVAPGLYAELGTLYLHENLADKAIAMYTREREAWPESCTLMTAMINNIAKRAPASEVKP